MWWRTHMPPDIITYTPHHPAWPRHHWSGPTNWTPLWRILIGCPDQTCPEQDRCLRRRCPPGAGGGRLGTYCHSWLCWPHLQKYIYKYIIYVYSIALLLSKGDGVYIRDVYGYTANLWSQYTAFGGVLINWHIAVSLNVKSK